MTVPHGKAGVHSGAPAMTEGDAPATRPISSLTRERLRMERPIVCTARTQRAVCDRGEGSHGLHDKLDSQRQANLMLVGCCRLAWYVAGPRNARCRACCVGRRDGWTETC